LQSIIPFSSTHQLFQNTRYRLNVRWLILTGFVSGFQAKFCKGHQVSEVLCSNLSKYGQAAVNTVVQMSRGSPELICQTVRACNIPPCCN